MINILNLICACVAVIGIAALLVLSVLSIMAWYESQQDCDDATDNDTTAARDEVDL